MAGRVVTGLLQVEPGFHRFVNQELLPAIDRDPDTFWSGLELLIERFAPRNRELLETRRRLQHQIDEWHRGHHGRPDPTEYKAFLYEIGYLVAEPDDFQVDTSNVDPEIASTSGPQLVVPVSNARFALNAVNARWGSLYDALYGSDAISEEGGATRTGAYNPVRGALVIDYVRALLDEFVPLAHGTHGDVSRYAIQDGRLQATLADGEKVGLAEEENLRGYSGEAERPQSVLLVHHGLHIELQFDPSSPVGASDRAGVKDVVVEAAVTTIVDFEDSVAAVDSEEKVEAYRNWLALNQGELSAEVTKDGRTFVRRLAPDRTYTGPDGHDVVLPGRSVVYVRNVGHLMTSDAVLDARGDEVGEGILDAVVTSAAALPGLDVANEHRTNRTGSIYIVKPKMHSPAEVAFTVDLFAGVEELLGLESNTIKLGLMDEERRLSLNLKAAIGQARQRIVFINTGFLDRSGDEIHTCMEAGPVVRKADMKTQRWIKSYEDQNVDIGLAAGLPGRAQIGKGMWTMPDLMADMVEQKIVHPRAGATTAWVPSPTAAVLHALHYHRVDVSARQHELSGHRRTTVDDLLELPLGDPGLWTDEDRQQEVDNSVQSIIGYVVRWIDQGIGCSKVPDIHDVALMEDRATLRISSQLLANWLHHGVVSKDQILDSLERMAVVVDKQNAGDPDYRPIATGDDSRIAFLAAQALIFEGTREPNGYTDPLLHRFRRQYKKSIAIG
jgi:malate synthase